MGRVGERDVNMLAARECVRSVEERGGTEAATGENADRRVSHASCADCDQDTIGGDGIWQSVWSVGLGVVAGRR